MEVLEKGRKQSGWAITTCCTGNGNEGGGCGAKLLVEQDDVFYTYSHCHNESQSYHTFRCPECGVWTDLPYTISLSFTPRSKDPRRDGESSGESLET